jgi:hypothetical protein
LGIDELLDEITIAKKEFKDYFSVDEVAYLDKWVEVFRNA